MILSAAVPGAGSQRDFEQTVASEQSRAAMLSTILASKKAVAASSRDCEHK